MTITIKPNRARIGKTGACLALGILMAVSTIGFAHAADRDWQRHEVAAHRDWHDHWHGHPGPGVVYAPPVVYAAPPPVESPGLNLILPINIR
jgi:hypothetical protein